MSLRYNPRSARLRFDRTKFRALVHYICWVCEDPRLLGPVRLGRLLWYVERNEYINSARVLSGATFVKRPYGPSPRALEATLRELEKEQVIATRSRRGDWTDAQYFAICEPDLSLLKADEISNIERTIRGVCFEESTSIPHRNAHERVFRVAAIGEALPCYTAFAGQSGNISERDVAWAIKHSRFMPPDRRLEELKELGTVSERVEEACLGLWWHLFREPSAGASVPGVQQSFFVYRQAGLAKDVPDMVAVYAFELDELVILGLHFELEEIDDNDDAFFGP